MTSKKNILSNSSPSLNIWSSLNIKKNIKQKKNKFSLFEHLEFVIVYE